MIRYNRAFLDDAFRRLGSLAPDQAPHWGEMRPPQLFAHLATSLRYGLGKEEPQPDTGGFFGHWIAAPLILNGIIQRPKNVEAPSMYDNAPPTATLDEARREAEEFLRRYEARDLDPPPHQYFGNIGLDGWAKLHVSHFEHHMRQFGV